MCFKAFKRQKKTYSIGKPRCGGGWKLSEVNLAFGAISSLVGFFFFLIQKVT